MLEPSVFYIDINDPPMLCIKGRHAREAVAAFIEHMRRVGSGWRVMMSDGGLAYRRQVIRKLLASGAAQPMCMERLPTYPPEPNPDENFRRQLNGVWWHDQCYVDLQQCQHDFCTIAERVRSLPFLKDVLQGMGFGSLA
jgi:hypothetical protein